MAGKSASILVKILGDESGFSKSLKNAESKLAGFSQKMQDTGQSMMKVGGAVTAAVTLPVAAMAVSSVKAFAEAEQAQAQLNASLQSTGATAWTSAAQIDTLAQSMQDKLAIDGDLVKSGASVLLTFTNVQNKAGEGNDIFNRATLAAADLSAKLGTDLSSANMLLGKALNDPIRGMAALRRAGVQLTDAQVKQVEGFMAVGDVASAQKVLLGELETQFGGSAEAAANTAQGGMEKLRLKFEDIQEAIGERLVPIIEKLGGWLEKGMAAWDSLGERGQTIVLIMAGVAAAIGPVVTVVGALVTAVGFIASPVGLVVAAIAGLIAALVYFYKTNEGFREWVNSVVTAVREKLATAFDYVRTTVIPALHKAFEWVRDNVFPVVAKAIEDLKPVIDSLGQAFGDAVAFVQAILPVMASFISDNVRTIAAVFEWLSPVISVVWDTIVASIQAAITFVRGVIKTVTALIKGDWSGVWNGIKTILSGVWAGIRAVVTGALNILRIAITAALGAIRGVFSSVWNGIKSATSGAFNTVKSVISGAMDGAKNVVSKVLDTIGNLFRKVKETAKNALSGLAEAVAAPFRAAGDAIKRAWNASVGGKGFSVPDWVPVIGGKTFNIPKLHSGGVFNLRGANEGLALLKDGETVRTRQQEVELQQRIAGRTSGATVIHVHFHGPVARDSERWVVEQVETAVAKGAQMPKLKQLVR